jgi:hypothetical protein
LLHFRGDKAVNVMRKILYLMLCCCLVETSFAMKQKELSRVQTTGKRAISKLIENGFENLQNRQQCLESINALITKLGDSGDQSGATILTLTHLKSIISIIIELQEYKADLSPTRKDKLLSIAQSYGNGISDLIHSVVD